MPINVFDLILLGTLVAGLICGRKRGMSEELLGLLKWLAIVVGAAIVYAPLGQEFARSNTVFSLLSCYLMAYIAAVLVIVTVFALVKRFLGGKLLGSDIFGRAEYYLGMGSGLIRFTCVLVCVLALLNARAYDRSEIKAMESFQNREFGSNYFPTLHTVQSIVFEQSLTGPWIRDKLGFLLIKPTRPESKKFKQKEYTMPY